MAEGVRDAKMQKYFSTLRTQMRSLSSGAPERTETHVFFNVKQAAEIGVAQARFRGAGACGVGASGVAGSFRWMRVM